MKIPQIPQGDLIAAVIAAASGVASFLTQPNATTALLIIAVVMLGWLLYSSFKRALSECRGDHQECKRELASLRADFTDLRQQYPDRRGKRPAR